MVGAEKIIQAADSYLILPKPLKLVWHNGSVSLVVWVQSQRLINAIQYPHWCVLLVTKFKITGGLTATFKLHFYTKMS